MCSVFETHTDLTVCGGPVRLYRAGDSGPPLLLLHGAMLDTGQGVWHDVVQRLSADYRVHVIDLPRHGGSRPWEGLLDDTFYHRFILELLDELDLPRVALIGGGSPGHAPRAWPYQGGVGLSGSRNVQSGIVRGLAVRARSRWC